MPRTPWGCIWSFELKSEVKTAIFVHGFAKLEGLKIWSSIPSATLHNISCWPFKPSPFWTLEQSQVEKLNKKLLLTSSKTMSETAARIVLVDDIIRAMTRQVQYMATHCTPRMKRTQLKPFQPPNDLSVSRWSTFLREFMQVPKKVSPSYSLRVIYAKEVRVSCLPSNRQFRKRWRQPQILQFCGDYWRISRESRPNQDMHTPYTSVVPAKLQDLRPSPSFTKSSLLNSKANQTRRWSHWSHKCDNPLHLIVLVLNLKNTGFFNP